MTNTPAITSESNQLLAVRKALSEAVVKLTTSFPLTSVYANRLNTLPSSVDAIVRTTLQQAESNKSDQILTSISAEELASIFTKLTELSQLPPGMLEKQSELYLEQQLSDLLGFTVSAEIDDQRLPYTNGVIAALPHIKRYHTDTLKLHENVIEAGITTNRSSFGWFSQKSAEQNYIHEQYYLALPMQFEKNNQQQSIEYQHWTALRKVIVLNPAEHTAIVAAIGTICYLETMKYQYGGSPELIRSGSFWSPRSQGKALVFFVDDPTDAVPFGPISFSGALK